MREVFTKEEIAKIICPTDKTFNKGRMTLGDYTDILSSKYCFAKLIQPDVIVEIGVRAGYSAWAFLQGCNAKNYIGIDADNGKHGGQGGKDGSYNRWASNLLATTFPNVNLEFIKLDTQTITINELDIALGIKSKTLLFHIDGDHTKKGVMHDMDLAATYFGNNRKVYVLIDDTNYINEVQEGVLDWLSFHSNICNIDNIDFNTKRGDYLVYSI